MSKVFPKFDSFKKLMLSEDKDGKMRNEFTEKLFNINSD
jgi:hypothetical protein